MTGLLRLAAVVGALFSLAVAAGCGGGASTPATSGEPISFERLSQAATSSADAASGRFDFSFEMTVPDTNEPFAFAGEGAFDTSSNRAELWLDFSSFAQLLGGLVSGFAGPNAKTPDFGDPSAWQIDAVQDGEVVYMRFPAMASELPAGKSWVRMDLDEAAGSQGFNFSQLQDVTSNDPRKMLEFLRAASGDIETVGTEELRGVATTHYRATVNLAEYEKLVPAEKREELRSTMGEMIEQTGLSELPVDVWLDENGLVRKVVMTLSAQQPGTSETVDGSMTFELYDYGKALGIELPPAAAVVDAADVD